MPGYYVGVGSTGGSGGVCQAIRSNCINWDPVAGTCNRCDWSYRLLSNGYCIKCYSWTAGYVNCEIGCSGT